uniref:Uncharacterized protein n=1 Tax=Nelumbo nucifera TaxID=4432 RepID=A0A822YJ74_NELNU|nr:TPA_asm: hypothetical protein HUJ06_011481 [Nelumbo nucifera]
MMFAGLAIKGNSAFLNFLELVHELPCPANLSHKDIHAAAAKAAAATFDKQPASCKVETEDQDEDALFDLPNLVLDHTTTPNIFDFSSSLVSPTTNFITCRLKERQMTTHQLLQTPLELCTSIAALLILLPQPKIRNQKTRSSTLPPRNQRQMTTYQLLQTPLELRTSIVALLLLLLQPKIKKPENHKLCSSSTQPTTNDHASTPPNPTGTSHEHRCSPASVATAQNQKTKSSTLPPRNQKTKSPNFTWQSTYNKSRFSSGQRL